MTGFDRERKTALVNTLTGSAVTNFETLVKAINKPRNFDGRSTIVIERVHDTLEAVIAVLLDRGEIFQYDSTLAVKSENGKRPIKVSPPWLQGHLREQFQFMERGKVVDCPPWLVKFVMKRWAQFPDFRFEA